MRHPQLALLASILIVAAGCTTTDPYTGEERTARATTGAAIGAVAGAAIGVATGSDSRDRRKRALIGAGVGGLAGAAVGGYMDRQEAKLREQLAGTGVSVTRVGDDIILNMPGNVTFGIDSADLRPEFTEVLNSVALVAKEFDKTLIEVAGHTDSTGRHAHNQRLSEQRAHSVARYLESRNLDSRRMAAAGFGPDYPIADNATEAGRAANRRVELTLVPLTAS